MLEKIYAQNLPNITTPFAVSSCPALEYVDTTGSTFTIDATIHNVYDKVYNASKIADLQMDSGGTQSVPPKADPNFDDSHVISGGGPFTITSNAHNLNARGGITPNHPYKTLGRQNTSGVMINSYGTRNTEKISNWTDEDKRLPATFDMNTVPETNEQILINGDWDSKQPLGPNDAAVYNMHLQYGSHINLTNSVPAGPDYTGKTGDQIYVRAFNIGLAKSGMTLTCPGLGINDVKPIGTGAINIEVKLPGITGWCDAGKLYNDSDFLGQPKDGAGIQTGVNGTKFSVTFGTFGTTDTNGWVLVRITFINASKSITGALEAGGN